MEILFPRNIGCISCSMPISRDNDLSICKPCYKKMKYIEEICTVCGRSGKGAGFCTLCSTEKYYFDKIYSVLEYNDFMHTLIYGYKYGHKAFLGEYFGEILKRFILENNIEFDYITGVPISKKREAQRGYNQSYLMAEYINREKFIELFIRNRETKFLSKLTKVQRMTELRGAFSLKNEDQERIVKERYAAVSQGGKNNEKYGSIKILIIDDILTTGSTAGEMSRLLKDNLYDIEIKVLTLCNARK